MMDEKGCFSLEGPDAYSQRGCDLHGSECKTRALNISRTYLFQVTLVQFEVLCMLHLLHLLIVVMLKYHFSLFFHPPWDRRPHPLSRGVDKREREAT